MRSKWLDRGCADGGGTTIVLMLIGSLDMQPRV